MAFRILKKVKDGGSALNSLYQFVPTTIDGVSYYLEFNTKEEVDEYVEEQLNLGLPKTALEVVAPMKYTVSASIEEEECGCGVPTTNPSPADKPYKIIGNPVDGIVEKGTRIVFIIDADRNKFQKLILDGAEVKSDYYTVTAGSTIISLVGIFADTLAIGEHTIEFIFSDGKATDKFEIVDAVEDTDPDAPIIDEPADPVDDPENPSKPSDDNDDESGNTTDPEGTTDGPDEENDDNVPTSPTDGADTTI